MSTFIIPPYLKEGDRVAIVSPSGVVERDVVYKARTKLEKSGFEVIIGKNVFNRHMCFAGTDDERLADLQLATDDPDVKAVFCSRGGYGTSRIIDKVDFSALRKNPKWYIGFSDITVLHLWLSQVCGVVSLHAEMPLNYSNPKKTPESYTSVISALKGEDYSISWKNTREATAEAKGIVTGGNLSLIYSLTGTPAEPDTNGTILIIEEIGEYYYHLDRMLTSLRLAGKLSNLAALVVGGMEKITHGNVKYNMGVEGIILDIVSQYSYPVIFNMPSGHISDNRAFFVGRKAVLSQKGTDVSLTYL